MNIKNLICTGCARILGKLYASEFVGNLTGNADTATSVAGVTATATELNYVDGVTSNIQTQLDSKSVIKTLASESLDEVKTPGFYNAGGGNTCANKPSGVDHFGLYVIHRAAGDYYTQIMIGSDQKQYRRQCENSVWSSWTEDTANFVPTTGGTMNGALVGQANTDYTTPQFRNITMSASEPTGGSNGQIHFQYS